jgi:hypothetical protein
VSNLDRDLEALWAAHERKPFPSRLRGADVGDIDLVLLDADTAACINVWRNNGDLDRWRTQVLASCLTKLGTVVAALTDPDESEYFRQLQLVAASVSAKVAGLNDGGP